MELLSTHVCNLHSFTFVQTPARGSVICAPNTTSSRHQGHGLPPGHGHVVGQPSQLHPYHQSQPQPHYMHPRPPHHSRLAMLPPLMDNGRLLDHHTAVLVAAASATAPHQPMQHQSRSGSGGVPGTSTGHLPSTALGHLPLADTTTHTHHSPFSLHFPGPAWAGGASDSFLSGMPPSSSGIPRPLTSASASLTLPSFSSGWSNSCSGR